MVHGLCIYFFTTTQQHLSLVQQYVYPSSIWMMRTQQNEFMFELMIKITQSMAQKVDNSMHSIFTHLGAPSRTGTWWSARPPRGSGSCSKRASAR